MGNESVFIIEALLNSKEFGDTLTPLETKALIRLGRVGLTANIFFDVMSSSPYSSLDMIIRDTIITLIERTGRVGPVRIAALRTKYLKV